MIKRKVAIILPYNDGKKVLIQDRRKISKVGEEYGFFGGGLESEETPKQALIREIKEELGIIPDKLIFFKTYKHFIEKIKGEVVKFLFLCKMPNIKDLKVTEGKAVIKNFNELFELKMIPGDEEILKDLKNFLSKKL